MNNSDLCWMSASDLAAAIATKKVAAKAAERTVMRQRRPAVGWP